MDFNKPLAERMDENKNENTDENGNESSNDGKSEGFFSSITNSFSNTINDMKSKDLSTATDEFVNSNTLVTKFVFIILVMIGFLILMNLGISLLLYFMLGDRNPYLVKGLINGNSQKTVFQDPNNSSSVTIYRSNNENKGIELTWSVWLKRHDSNSTNELDHIFNKGSSIRDENSDEPILGNGPGVYFFNDGVSGNNRNKIKIIMDTVVANTGGIVTKEVIINDLPFKKWFHLAIRIENKVMDVYVNGEIVKRESFEHVPKQNYGNVNICHNKGFSGNLSDLRYYSSALNVFQISNIVSRGPNLKSNEDDNSTYDYLANMWYVSNKYE